MKHDFDIREKVQGNVAVLVLAGRFDANVASDVKEHIRQMAESGRKDVVLDMQGVSFLDSSGLGALVASLRTLQNLGGRLKIGGLSQKVRVVLELIKLHKVLDLYPDAASAVEALAGNGAE
ncbi:STAS domain-containing protein [Desulfovibrio subterraneus]|uniref:Anti-sigma factor antagonist n=1 Tax=Desulfovibrio subterraneus TaxID=2718620 RepID=A0A7J0BLG5_9BACT|nr:STAS domain-containing protein [Desulfovibrio subterraneus]GFM34479.1 anti-sigma factor antagonist [Desulfovibrio subterraneus]